jgi:hypothetical protein
MFNLSIIGVINEHDLMSHSEEGNHEQGEEEHHMEVLCTCVFNYEYMHILRYVYMHKHMYVFYIYISHINKLKKYIYE